MNILKTLPVSVSYGSTKQDAHTQQISDADGLFGKAFPYDQGIARCFYGVKIGDRLAIKVDVPASYSVAGDFQVSLGAANNSPLPQCHIGWGDTPSATISTHLVTPGEIGTRAKTHGGLFAAAPEFAAGSSHYLIVDPQAAGNVWILFNWTPAKK